MMDEELLNNFSSSVKTSDTQARYTELYKRTSRYSHQEERRKKILEEQKKNRNDRWDHFRGISQVVNSSENKLKWAHTNYATYYKPSIYVAGFNQVASNYKNVLMLSEWMVEKPSDFHENWYLTPSPKGLRCLLVATKGITRLYNKYGYLAYDCLTGLPGGSSCMKGNNKYSSSVLDGFFQSKNNTFYVLDVLAWNEQNMTDGETEFRHYWIESQIKDCDEIKNMTSRNEMNFVVLPKISCEIEKLNQYLSQHSFFENNYPILDGFLFYHKYGHYHSGETPLVGWLFPFMIPEILGNDIKINPIYLETKPRDYENQASFIKVFEIKLKAARELKKKYVMSVIEEDKGENKREKRGARMEVVPTETVETVTKDEDTESNTNMEFESTSNIDNYSTTSEIDEMEEQQSIETQSQESEQLYRTPTPAAVPWSFVIQSSPPEKPPNTASEVLQVKPFQFTAFSDNIKQAKIDENGCREYTLF